MGMNKPYKDLYIYEIEGDVPHPRRAFREDLLGHWSEGNVSYLFFSAKKKEEIEAYLNNYPALSFLSETVIDYKDWESGKEFKPFRVGPLQVSPIWEEVENADHAIHIKVDPLLAFGSGNHATTKQCLEALCFVYQEDRPQRVLDLGCGTGILAVAAAKLGAATVLAVDYSSLAVETAERNCHINGVVDIVQVKEGEAEEYLAWDAQLLLANIRYYVIEELMKSSHFMRKGWYVLSGLLRSEEEKLLTQLPDLSISVIKVLREGSWSTVVGRGL
jgi:ribosomal protein L11 methyltransferase